MPITDTQRAILDLIATRIEAEGVPPSQAEIARAFGFSGVRAAQYHLEALEAALADRGQVLAARDERDLAAGRDEPRPEVAARSAHAKDDDAHHATPA